MVLTGEGFGARLLYKSSGSDDFDLQLALFLHHTNLNVTYLTERRPQVVWMNSEDEFKFKVIFTHERRKRKK